MVLAFVLSVFTALSARLRDAEAAPSAPQSHVGFAASDAQIKEGARTASDTIERALQWLAQV